MTKNSIAYNRTLFLEDNLPVLQGLDSESVDLIATDPPFNKGAPAFTGTTKAGQNVEFKDIWNWNDDVHTVWTEEIGKDHPSLFNVIRYANAAAGDDMGAFLCWMAVRVLEMHRVLKPNGSMYLHCDPTASHYLKAIMDAIFGRHNFRNEIVWKRSGGKSDAKRWGRVSDRLLYYTRSSKFTWNRQYYLYNPDYVRRTYRQDDNDGRGAYTTMPLHAAGQRTGESGEPWRGIDPTPMGRHWATPTKGVMNTFIIEKGIIPGWPDEYPSVHARLDALDHAGLVVHGSGLPGLKTYLAATRGVAISDVVVDIPMAKGKERTGYPTQKPLALYKRMIEASSNPGDMVLDPFAGCATTCVAAEQLGRQWIGIDIREESGDVIRERLENEVNGSMAWNDIVRTPTTAPERTDDGDPVAPELAVVGRKRNARQISVSKLRGELVDRDGLRCQGCGWVPHQVDYLQVDHNQPKSLEGSDEMENLALLCEPCNRKKSNKLTLHELRLDRASDGDWMNMEWWEKEKWKR